MGICEVVRVSGAIGAKKVPDCRHKKDLARALHYKLLKLVTEDILAADGERW